MPYRGTTIPLPGLMTGYIAGQPPGLLVKEFTVENVLTSVLFRVTETPANGDLVIELNDLEDGTGQATQVTILQGETYAESTGLSVSVEALWQIVRSEAGTDSAMNLSGEYEMNSVTGVEDYFTTLTKVKQDADISGTDADRDTVLNQIIAGVTRQMQDWMGRMIVQGTVTDEKIDGNGDDEIYLGRFPLIEVTALTEDDTALVEDTDFEAVGPDLEAGRIVRISGTNATAWSSGRRNIKLTYDYGYVTGPDSLVTACTSLVVAKFFETVQSGKGWGGVLSKGVDPNASVSYDKDIWTRETIPAMAPYRRMQA
jgi:hypothetical protein